eukprot:6032277-Pleurochrysis_carterae.AAC.1
MMHKILRWREPSLAAGLGKVQDAAIQSFKQLVSLCGTAARNGLLCARACCLRSGRREFVPAACMQRWLFIRDRRAS